MILYACIQVTKIFTAPGDVRSPEHSGYFFKDLILGQITISSSQVNKSDKKNKRNSSILGFRPIFSERVLGLKYFWEPGFLRVFLW